MPAFRSQFFLFIILLLFAMVSACSSESEHIVIGKNATELEIYSAKELQRYIYQLSGKLLQIIEEDDYKETGGFIIGQQETNSIIRDFAEAGVITIKDNSPGPQGYLLKTIKSGNRDAIVIAGTDPEGCLYGVYGLLDEHYGMEFYFSGDTWPEKTKGLKLVNVEEVKTPSANIRGILPWTNFPQAATSYSWEDWTHIIDQMARMRMNFIHIHNYSGGAKHNEMFANFEHDGILPRVWMATARSGHGWSCPGWDVSKYKFGSQDLFDDYDFGADCALHNETLDNYQVLRKAVSEFQRVISYAHSRGVRMGLGIDINQVPLEYEADAGEPSLVKARVQQITDDYPDLDYLLLFQSEHIARNEVLREKWRTIFDTFYDEIKQKSLPIKVAVSGWGLAAKDVATLPEDVICAPIASYTAGFESGEIYGDREYWGCPWLEKDGDCSQYYYPYTIHLSNTIEAWKERAPNMTGLYCLTWRITDAIDPKISYIAKAPWSSESELLSSREVYREYAVNNYGTEVAETITGIIDENEPWVDSQGECRPTLPFTEKAKRGRANICKVEYFQFLSDGQTMKKIPAIDFSDKDGWVQKVTDTEGTDYIGNINSADWVQYEQVDFGSGSDKIRYRLSSLFFNAYFELRLDSLEGELLQNCKISRTGSWDSWQEFTVPIKKTSGKHKVYIVFHPAPETSMEIAKAEEQLRIIDSCILIAQSPAKKENLKILRCRIASTHGHLVLNRDFENYVWEDLPGAMDSWINNFNYRITDISSLGTIISVQNRYVSQNYLEKEFELMADLDPLPISVISAKGTRDGAFLEWEYQNDNVKGFIVYRDSEKVFESPLTPDSRNWSESISGKHSYSVSVIDADGRESLLSPAQNCEAGASDISPPFIVMVTPPTSVARNQPAWIKIRIMDNRVYEEISATLFFRTQGNRKWNKLPMDRRIRAVFTASIPGSMIAEDGLEYYIEATDGSNRSVYPLEGNLSLTSYTPREGINPGIPVNVTSDGSEITWESPETGEVFWYRIYRDRDPEFKTGPATLLTYLEKRTTGFYDNGYDFSGDMMKGNWYYRISSVDKWGRESEGSPPVEINSLQLHEDLKNKVDYIPNESFSQAAARRVL